MSYHDSRQIGIGAPGPAMSNASLGTILFSVAELMLFVGLIAGYIVLRFGSDHFSGMPHLPMGLTIVSTPVLLLSSLALVAAQRAVGQGRMESVKRGAIVALLLGLAFLALQGIEWSRLIEQQLIPSSSVASGMFYLLSGVHGVHVVVGLVLLAILSLRINAGRVGRLHHSILTISSIYWHFVTLLWVTLFYMIFIA